MPEVIRKPRRDAGVIQWTGRDLRALAWIADQYAVRADDLVQVLATDTPLSRDAVRMVVARWRKAGVVAERKLLAEDPPWVWLTRSGLTLLGLKYAYWQPGLSQLGHIHAVNRIRLLYDRNYGRLEGWTSERQLRQSATLHAHVPDAVAVTVAGEAAIEVELTCKGADRLCEIAYALAAQYERTLVFAVPESSAWRAWLRLLQGEGGALDAIKLRPLPS